jgi:hypothetical protein
MAIITEFHLGWRKWMQKSFLGFHADQRGHAVLPQPFTPLTSPLSPLPSPLSPLTSHLSPLTSHLTSGRPDFACFFAVFSNDEASLASIKNER